MTTVKQIVQELNLQVVTSRADLNQEVVNGYVGDLLSVVMAKAKPKSAWITIQGHMTIIAVAKMIESPLVIISEGFKVEQAVINKAEQENLVLAESDQSAFELCRLLVV